MRGGKGLFLMIAVAGNLLARTAAAQLYELDAAGSPVSPETRHQYETILKSLPDRKYSEREKDFLLALLNRPEYNYGALYKSKPELVRYFARAGVRILDEGGPLQSTNMWRLFEAGRAASNSFAVPVPVLMCLIFRESSFDPDAAGYSTSAKGIAQITNPAVHDILNVIQNNTVLSGQLKHYVRELGIAMPESLEHAPQVDAINKQIRELKAKGAPASVIKKKQKQKERLIQELEDEPGHIFNLETNLGLGAAYLSYLRYQKLAEVRGEKRIWLTAVGAYNQGYGIARELIYKVFRGARDYNMSSVDAIFSQERVGMLSIPPERQAEMLGEVRSVYRCAFRH